MKKLLNKKGFTLMEMLIVVAIIVILVAVSVPTFTSSLDNAKKATDDANLRAAKAVAVNAYMLGEEKPAAGYVYNLETGKFENSASVKGYGESDTYKDQIIVFTLTDGSPSAAWAAETDTN